MQEFCVVWFFLTISVTISVIFLSCCYSCHPCFLLYYSISEWCQVLFMVWMYVQGGDVRVTTGRCFIFVMKYIMLTYIQAGIMFNSSVVEFLYFIRWKRERNVGSKWIEMGQLVLVRSCAGVHLWKVRTEWLKYGNLIVSGHSKWPQYSLFHSHDPICNMIIYTNVHTALMPIKKLHTNVTAASLCTHVWGVDRACVHSHIQYFFCHEAIFHPYHSKITKIDKDDARPVCFTSTHVVLAKGKVHFRERMSEQSKSTSVWMNPLFSQTLLLCWQQNKSLLAPPSLKELESFAATYHQDRWWWLLWGGLNSCPNGTNNYFLTSSCNSDECVTSPMGCKYNLHLPPCSNEEEIFLAVKGKRVSHRAPWSESSESQMKKVWLKHGCISYCRVVNISS